MNILNNRRADMSSIRNEFDNLSAGAMCPPLNDYTDWEFQIDSQKGEHIQYGRIIGYASTEQQARQFQNDILNSLKALYFMK